jgi:menaquinone-9 beta-reductase
MRLAIVGAGPAGCSAGFHLASAGHDVTLIDRRPFPRDKVCGDGISAGALTALSTMGIYPRDLSALPESAAIYGTLVGAPNGQTNQFRSRMRGYCIPRYVFDALLHRRAVAAGCRFEVRTVRDPATLDADIVIDARGVYAGDPNAIALRSYWDVPVSRLAPNEVDTIQVRFERFLGPAYGWVFPVASGPDVVKLNVGVGIWKHDAERMGTNVKALYARFVGQNARVRELSVAAVKTTTARGCALAMAKRNNQVTDGRVLRIGDAANMTDPLTGEGIQNALLSGMLVAQAIELGRSIHDAPANWERIYRDQFEEHFRAGLRLSSAMGSGLLKNMLVRMMNHDSRIAERMNAAITDLVRYDALMPSMVRTFFPG